MEEEKRICKVRTPAAKPSPRAGKRVFAELPCPGSLTGPCTPGKCRWSCEKCNKYIEFGFDGKFYCDCGKASTETFTFNCGSEKHGGSYIQFPTIHFCEFIKEFSAPKEVNILLLGETGVGKSTFINGIVNYLNYKTLEDAMVAEPFYLIPTLFTVMDKDCEEKKIKVGASANEQHSKEDQSATQSPISYSVMHNDKVFRIIDTPGLEDTRGTDHDKIHFQEIISHISSFTELHGICILLKPNVSRLSQSFRYCLTELLNHLHRDVANNIVFCFTHTRATDYNPGTTLVPLRALLKEFEDKKVMSVEISLSKKNWFCVDNEAFRYCCASGPTEKVEFSQNVYCNFANSWKVSAEQTHKLFDYVSKLHPHECLATVSLNRAKSVISSLSKPMIETLKTISINISRANTQKLTIEDLKRKGADLQKNLKIIRIRLVAEDIDYPRMVCTECSEHSTLIVDVYDSIEMSTPKLMYEQICHNKCGVKKSTEFASAINTENCSVMKRSMFFSTAATTKCRACGCSADKHIRVKYKMVLKTFEIDDVVVKGLIDRCASDAEVAQIMKKVLEDEIKELEDERDKILEIAAHFGSFMKTHAIARQKDAFEDCINSRIECQADSTDRTLHDYLVATRDLYLKQVELLNKNHGNHEITIKEVNEQIETLLALPRAGADLKQILHVATEAEKKTVMYDDNASIPKKLWKVMKGGALGAAKAWDLSGN